MMFDQYLLSKIKDEENNEAKSIIEGSNLYRSIDPHGATLLHYCAEYGNEIMAQYLLDNDCDINAQDINNRTPLMQALDKLHAEVATILLEADVDVFVRNVEGRSALDMLIEIYSPFLPISKCLRNNIRQRFASSEDAARGFIQAGYQLHQALFLKDAKITEYMLENGFRDHLTQTIDRYVTQGYQTLVHLAVMLQDSENLKVLLKFGANPHAKNSYGTIPLTFVYIKCGIPNPNQLEILKILLDPGIPETENRNDILSNTMLWGPAEAVGLILRSHVDFKARSSTGRTALHYFAQNTKPGIAAELEAYTHEFEVNVLDEKLISPLQIAAFLSNIQMLQLLLTHGADVDHFHNDNPFPALFNVYQNYKSKKQSDLCIELLLQHNADPQFVAGYNNNQLTIFDKFDKNTADIRVERLKPVIAHLALLKKCGTPITELIYSKINSRDGLKKNVTRCQQVLDKKIAGRLTIFHMLTANEKTMSKYLKNQKLVIKLMHISHRRKLKSRYTYYYSTLEKRINKGFLYKTLKDRAAVVICHLLEYRLNESSLIVEKINDYLDEITLRQLHRM